MPLIDTWEEVLDLEYEVQKGDKFSFGDEPTLFDADKYEEETLSVVQSIGRDNIKIWKRVQKEVENATNLVPHGYYLIAAGVEVNVTDIILDTKSFPNGSLNIVDWQTIENSWYPFAVYLSSPDYKIARRA